MHSSAYVSAGGLSANDGDGDGGGSGSSSDNGNGNVNSNSNSNSNSSMVNTNTFNSTTTIPAMTNIGIGKNKEKASLLVGVSDLFQTSYYENVTQWLTSPETETLEGLYGMGNTMQLKEKVPNIYRILCRAGLTQNGSRMYTIYTTCFTWLQAIAQSTTFVLSFSGFGVPLFLAIAFGVGWFFFIMATFMVMTVFARTRKIILLITFDAENSEKVAKGGIYSAFFNALTFVIITGLLTWFSIKPSYYGLPPSSPLFIVAVACPAVFCLSILQPGNMYFIAWVNSLFGIWQPAEAGCIKCYAGLLSTLCDDSMKPEEKVSRMQQMFTQVTRYASRKSYGKRMIFYNAVLHFQHVPRRLCVTSDYRHFFATGD